MRMNLPAILFIFAFALLSIGAVATSGTLWQGEIAASVSSLCASCVDELAGLF